MTEFTPATYVEDQDVAREMANQTDALRTDAALRRVGTKMIDKMVSVGAKPYEVTGALSTMSQGEGVTSDQLAPKAAEIAYGTAADDISENGGKMKSLEQITGQMNYEAAGLDAQANDIEDKIAARYEEKR